jgi:hypothetical protein
MGIAIALGMYQVAVMNATSREPTDKHNSKLSGAAYLKELKSNPSTAFIENMRMSETTFKKLNKKLQ